MNPVAYTVAILAAAAVGGLIAATAWAWLGARRFPSSGLSGRTAIARAASYAILALALGAAVAVGTVGVAILLAIIGAVALMEWCRLTNLPRHHLLALEAANVAIMATIAAVGPSGTAWLVGGIVLLGMAWPVVLPDPTRAMRDLGFAAVGCAVISGTLVHGVALAYDGGEIGAVLVGALAIATACADVGAYLVGRRFGRTPLAPRLSPSKTRAGVAGNMLGAALGLALFAPVLVPTLGWGALLLLVPIVGLGAVWGDLFESAVKREGGTKDAGSWLPGFGGILDRVDSLLAVLPLSYWALRIIGSTGGG